MDGGKRGIMPCDGTSYLQMLWIYCIKHLSGISNRLIIRGRITEAIWVCA